MSRTSEWPVVRQARKFGLMISSSVNFTSSAVKGVAVVPADVVTQADAPVETVLRNAAVLLARHFDGQIGLENALGVDAEQRVEHREVDRRRRPRYAASAD